MSGPSGPGNNDMITELLSGNPNEPVNRGVVLLFRNEMRSEFKTLNGRMDKLEQRMDKLEQRMDKLEQRMDKLEQRMDNLEQRVEKLQQTVEMIAQYVAKIFDRLEPART